MAKIAERDLISGMGLVSVSRVLYQYILDDTEKKLGESFKGLDNKTFRMIARKKSPDLIVLKMTDEPKFELIIWDIVFLKDSVSARVVLRSSHLWGELGEQLKFFAALKEHLVLKEVGMSEEGWEIRTVLAGDHHPIRVDKGGGQKIFVSAGEVDVKIF